MQIESKIGDFDIVKKGDHFHVSAWDRRELEELCDKSSFQASYDIIELQEEPFIRFAICVPESNGDLSRIFATLLLSIDYEKIAKKPPNGVLADIHRDEFTHATDLYCEAGMVLQRKIEARLREQLTPEVVADYHRKLADWYANLCTTPEPRLILKVEVPLVNNSLEWRINFPDLRLSFWTVEAVSDSDDKVTEITFQGYQLVNLPKY